MCKRNKHLSITSLSSGYALFCQLYDCHVLLFLDVTTCTGQCQYFLLPGQFASWHSTWKPKRLDTFKKLTESCTCPVVIMASKVSYDTRMSINSSKDYHSPSIKQEQNKLNQPDALSNIAIN